MDDLCGITYYSTTITVTKYMAGMVLMERMKTLIKRKKLGGGLLGAM